MTGTALRGIDHVVVIVADIEAAHDGCERLGFQLQPRGTHARLGTANHLMVFGDNYLELVGIVEPNPLNAERRRWLADTGGGLANAALRTEDADVTHAAWTAAGLQPDPVLALGRAVAVEGRQEQAEFRIVRLGTHRARLMGFLACQHLTPQFVYRPEWARHANGTQALIGVTVVAEHPETDEAYVRKVFGEQAVCRSDGAVVVESGGVPIRYMRPDRFEALYPRLAPHRDARHAALLSFRVVDVTRTETVLGAGGVAYAKGPDGGILVADSAVGGISMEFVRG
jgi:hypothetical protein